MNNIHAGFNINNSLFGTSARRSLFSSLISIAFLLNSCGGGGGGSAAPASGTGSANTGSPIACSSDSASAATITALTPNAGQVPVGTTYRKISVQASLNGAPLVGCNVAWSPVNGKANGWVFPDAEETDANGRVSAWWTAGENATQTLTASIVRRNGSQTSALITGQTYVAHAKNIASYVNWSTDAWDRFSVDVTPLTWAETTYYAAVLWPGAYTGIQSHELIFSVWDVNGVSPLIIDQGVSTCVNFGGEGTGLHCSVPIAPEINVVYRFEVEIAPTLDGKLDYTVYFTDPGNGIRKKFATLRYQAATKAINASAFDEDWLDAEVSCLANPVRAVLFSNVKYRNEASGLWIPVTTATGTTYYSATDNFCGNYRTSAESGGFRLSTGGYDVGSPLHMPDSPRAVNLSLN